MHELGEDEASGDAASVTAGSGERSILRGQTGRIESWGIQIGDALQSTLVALLQRASQRHTTAAKLLLGRFRVDEHDPDADRLQGVGPPVPKGRNLVAWFRGMAKCYRESSESPHPLNRENADGDMAAAAEFDDQANKLELAIDAAEGLPQSRTPSGTSLP